MSLTIGIRFLTGYCVAARSKTDPRPEWPPHPARVFMALAAAHFECEAGAAERQALDWLESLDPPAIHLSAQAVSPDAVPTFVPMNDSWAVGRGGSIQTLPALKRHRAERRFPRTHLPENEDCIYLNWSTADPAALNTHRPALTRLCGAVTRVGHSSSLVHVWLAGEPPTALKKLAPSSHSTLKLRVVAKTQGTLERLSIAFQTPPYRPAIKSAHGYAESQVPGGTAATTVFDDRLEFFRLESAGSSFRWLQLESTLALSHTLRNAILERCQQPVPESICGHQPDGLPSASPHMAILPLPFVGNEHGDGHLLGVAIAMPRDMCEADQRALLDAMEAIAGHGLGFDPQRFPGLGQWALTPQGVFDDHRVNMRVDTWTASPGGARRWASVTPVVFDQHSAARSKGAYLDECTRLARESVLRVVIGIDPEGLRVRLTPVSPVAGVPSARDFPRLKRKNGTERRHTHVEIEFDRPVVGPLLIGAGRYRGYGLLRPIREGGAS